MGTEDVMSNTVSHTRRLGTPGESALMLAMETSSLGGSKPKRGIKTKEAEGDKRGRG